MSPWKLKNIRDAFSQFIELNAALHKLDSIDEATISQVCDHLNIFLKGLCPIVGYAETSLHPIGYANIEAPDTDNPFKKVKIGETTTTTHPIENGQIGSNTNTINCFINGSRFFTSLKDIQKMLRSMNILKDLIDQGMCCHFKVTGVEEVSEIILSDKAGPETFESEDENFSQEITKPNPSFQSNKFLDGQEAENSPVIRASRTNNLTRKNSKNKPKKNQINLSLLKRKGLCVPDEKVHGSEKKYEKIMVEPTTSWGHALLINHFPQPDAEKKETNEFKDVCSIFHINWNSLWQLTTAIMVNYHVAFGNFSRLETCRNCGKLFYQRRINRKEFCEKICRVIYNQALEPKDIQKCRKRQNEWIKRKCETCLKNLTHYTINKSECAGCVDTASKGGQCQKLIEKNRDNLLNIQQYSKMRQYKR